ELRSLLGRYHVNGAPVEIVHAPDVVRMNEQPTEVFRRKDSSVRVAMRMIKDGTGDAVVSTGNTGAVMAAGLADLGRLPGVSRPAIACLVPSEHGGTLLLDVGANPVCKTHNLMEFAVMGSVYMESVINKTQPRVALLSIGEEPSKGTELTVSTHRALSALPLNFVGNIEGRDILSGRADVVVCDGFVGNIMLKFAESLQGFLTNAVRRQISRNYFSHFGAILMGPFLRRMKRTFDYAEYGGAPLLGLEGVCMICHGSSSPKAIKNAIWSAATGAAHHVNQNIVEALALYRPAMEGAGANGKD
ncbi:MAG: phosphate acyltransferase PlsX, partial [candidate division Zixibacteria bacterium]|nr:phosphate acyltransferase PlsX [candidate division Zixibacteria bacterium]